MESTVFGVGGFLFALDTYNIIELVRIDVNYAAIKVSDFIEFVSLRNESIPVYEIINLTGLPDKLVNPYLPDFLVIVEHKHMKIAIKADSIMGNHRLIKKTADNIFPKSRGINAFGILENGSSCLILDLIPIYDYFMKNENNLLLPAIKSSKVICDKIVSLNEGSIMGFENQIKSIKLRHWI